MSPSSRLDLEQIGIDFTVSVLDDDPYEVVRAARDAGQLGYHDAIELELLDRPTPSAATLQRLREDGVPPPILGCPIVSLREEKFTSFRPVASILPTTMTPAATSPSWSPCATCGSR